MSTAALLLVLASAFIHALWNALLRRDPAPRDAVGPISLVAAFVALVPAIVRHVPLRVDTVAFAALAGAFEAAYFLGLGRAMATAPLGPVYTLARGGAVFLVWPASIALFGETLTPLGAGAALLLVVGLACTSPASAVSAAHRVGLRWAALTGVFIAGYHLAYTASLRRGGDAPTLAAISLAIAGAFHLGRVRIAQGALPRLTIRRAAAGALAGIGFVLFLAALAEGAGAGLVLTLRNGSVLFAMVFGLAFGERPRRLQWAGAGLVVLGAALLSFHP